MPKKNVATINCPYCGDKIITTKTRLIKLENEEKSFSCPNCNMNFSIKSEFETKKIEEN